MSTSCTDGTLHTASAIHHIGLINPPLPRVLRLGSLSEDDPHMRGLSSSGLLLDRLSSCSFNQDG